MKSFVDLRKKQELPSPRELESLTNICFENKEVLNPKKDAEEVKKLFPHTCGMPLLKAVEKKAKSHKALKVGVVFSGGQASGGHNVIVGLHTGLHQLHSQSQLIGFLDGPSGITKGKYKELKVDELDGYKNTGGFNLLGSGRDKIETQEQLSSALQVVKDLSLDGLVIIGGDDSNTNAAVLAEYFLSHGCETKVVGVPKTIDGDLKNEWVEISFGFDTACRTYSEMIGNIQRDALSAKKYTHFIKLMGRSASHIALECSLLTHPNFVMISEEIEKNKTSLQQIVSELTEMIIKRSKNEKNYSVILIPEGVIEFIPEMKELINALNKLLVDKKILSKESLEQSLNKESYKTFQTLPESIQEQLLLDRDPHGNVQVSHIQTEKLFIEMVRKQLEIKKFEGAFSPVAHFFGYEGRSGFPSNFDAMYCLALGKTAAALISNGASGYMAAIKNLSQDVSSWEIFGVPITSLMNMETRKGKSKPVIKKALVDLGGKAFQFFASQRVSWQVEDNYLLPGPMQFFGPPLTDQQRSPSLLLEK